MIDISITSGLRVGKDKIKLSIPSRFIITINHIHCQSNVNSKNKYLVSVFCTSLAALHIKLELRESTVLVADKEPENTKILNSLCLC